MKVLVTGGCGFVGSHACEYFAQKGYQVVALDNLARGNILGQEIDQGFNLNFLNSLPNVEFVQGDIRDFSLLQNLCQDVDVIIHTAAQVAVTASMKNPREDFEINALGTFNVLEAARQSLRSPCIIYCSTNKVYGDNVNKISVAETGNRYEFADENYKNGIAEDFPTDLCTHTPYGCSKFAADVYVQDYGPVYGLRTGVFRMSCIYGTRQFGVEDQGWVAWFAIATLLGRPITIYGDGKQVRDVLYVSDLIRAFDLFINSDLKQAVFNIGGGVENTLSLIELLDLLQELTGKRAGIRYADWRPSDQKVYISNTAKAQKKLRWKAQVNPKEGVGKLIKWVEENKEIFVQKSN
jgi:CDP-paratose 2-epimerase